MKVNTKKFIRMVKDECGSLSLFCIEFEISRAELAAILLGGLPFSYEQSERMMNAFGAEKMVKVRLVHFVKKRKYNIYKTNLMLDIVRRLKSWI